VTNRNKSILNAAVKCKKSHVSIHIVPEKASKVGQIGIVLYHIQDEIDAAMIA